MNTDIIERLRDEVRDWQCGTVVSEAADHIERLYIYLKTIADWPVSDHNNIDAANMVNVAKAALNVSRETTVE
jgi:hypothetical protein